MISDSGHSRIPIYFGNVDHIVGLLLVRDLAFLNPEDETPLRTILEYYGRQIIRVYADIGLDELLREFRETHVHMAVVWQVNDAPDGGDPIPKNLGIVTLEDVIEEIIQMEINDETDATDYKKIKQAFGIRNWKKRLDLEKTTLPPQQKKAVAAFLSGDLELFGSKVIRPEALDKLLDMSMLQEFASDESASGSHEPSNNQLYEKGKHSDYCTIVLQGKVQITSGSENFVSEIGPFTYLALNALTHESYTADFTAVAKGGSQILQIKKAGYISAIKATEISQYELSSFLCSFLFFLGVNCLFPC